MSTVTRRPPGPAQRRSSSQHTRTDSFILGQAMRWEVGLCLLIVVVMIGSSVASSNFFTPFNLETMALNSTVLGLLALGVAPVIITGDIDLSIASILALCGVVMAVLWQHGMNIWVAAVVAVVLGSVLGLVNGLIVVLFNLPSLAVTLGTMSTYTGIAFLVLQGNAIIDFPPSLVQLGSGGILGSDFPIASAVLLVCAAILAFIIHRTAYGKAIFAIGGNRQAAHFSGVPVARTRILVFVIAGIFSALAAIFYLGNFDTAQANMAADQLLPAITAVILGGVSAYGGTGTIPGVVLALILLQVLETGLGIAGLSGQEQTISVGILLIIAISGGAAINAARNRFRRSEQRSSAASPETKEEVSTATSINERSNNEQENS